MHLHRQGRNAEARALCAQILQREPRSEPALALHGTVCALLGNREEAIATFEQAAKYYPESAPFHYMLGNLFREAAQWQIAARHYRQALACRPEFADAWNNLGLTLHELECNEEAMDCYRRALQIDARNPRACYNLGNSFQKSEQYREAIDCYRQVLTLRPNDAEALFNLGNAHLACGQLTEAIGCYRRLHELEPTRARGLANLGVALHRIGRHREALDALENALQIEPQNARTLVAIGNIRAELNAVDAAVSQFERAIERHPGYADAFFNLGNVLHRDKRFESARDALRKAVELEPDNSAYLGGLIGAEMALWNVDEAERLWRRLMKMWGDGQLVPIDMMLEMTDDPRLQLQCAMQHARQLTAKVRIDQSSAGIHGLRTSAQRTRYRIGYLSSDFGEHPVGQSLVEVLERHDRSRFEVIGISLQRHPEGAMRNRIIAACERFLDIVDLDLADSVRSVRELELDAIVDLAGYTADARPLLLAARVAPIQAAYLGFAGTQGAPWLDYLIADRYTVPSGYFSGYTEKIAWLAGCGFPSDTTLAVPDEISGRAVEGLPDDAVVFACFNNAKRISKETMEAWLDILGEVRNSVLWLQQGYSAARDNLRSFAHRRDIAPSRLIFARFVAFRPEHIVRHRLADLYLDTFPYNSHSTARDALYVGLPVLTCSGRSYASRVAGSLLSALQLPELVTDNLSDYKRAAIELARDPAQLRMLRTRLGERSRRAGLFDTVRVARDLEQTFAAMIDRSRSGLPTVDLDGGHPRQ